MSRDFNGSSQYGQNTSVSINSASFSICGWFRFTGTIGANQTMFSAENAGGTHWVDVQLRTDGTLRLQVNGSTSQSGATVNTITTGAWQHVAVVGKASSGADARVIVLNGDWANRGSCPDSNTTDTLTKFSMATLDANGNFYSYFDGMEAQFAQWNADLSQAEVEGLAGPFSSGSQSGSGDNPLVVDNANLGPYWPMVGTASPEPDDNGSLDLTLTGSPPQGANDPVVDSSSSNTDYNPAAGAIVAVGGAPLINPQFAAPITDTSAGGWTPSTGGSLFGVIDEVVRDDGDYMQSAVNPSSDTATLKLATISDPGTDAGFEVESACGATGATGTVVISIRQGNSPGSEIAAWTHSGLPVGSYARFRDGVSSAQAANITDFTDLYIRFVAS